MDKTLVLSIGLDAELLSTRNLVLQSAGYIVVPALSLKEALGRLLGGDLDLVLLCQSIPTKDKDRLTSWIRASGSRIPVVSVSGYPGQRDAFADATVEGNPHAVLVGLREALVKAAIPKARTATFDERREAAVTDGKKLPQSTGGDEEQTKTTKERSFRLKHAG